LAVGFGRANAELSIADAIGFPAATDSCPDAIANTGSGDAKPDHRATVTLADARAPSQPEDVAATSPESTARRTLGVARTRSGCATSARWSGRSRR
jgi:hypothetical protein